jgi:hypothetical protein
MSLPTIDVSDLLSLVPNISNISTPIRGGQKIVFPCDIDGQKQALKIMLANPHSAGNSDDTVTARAKREIGVMADWPR